MIKAVFLKVYEIAYNIERQALKTGIYTECDLYDVRYNYGTKQIRKKLNENKKQKRKNASPPML